MINGIERFLGLRRELPPAVVLSGRLARAQIDLVANSLISDKSNLELANIFGSIAYDVLNFTEKRVALTDTPFFQRTEEKFEYGKGEVVSEDGSFKTEIGPWYVYGGRVNSLGEYEVERVTPELIERLRRQNSRALIRLLKQTPRQIANRFITFVDRVTGT